jgi:hypothetical protein
MSFSAAIISSYHFTAVSNISDITMNIFWYILLLCSASLFEHSQYITFE